MRRLGPEDQPLRSTTSETPRHDGAPAPALLELRGDETIVGIAGSATPFRKRGFISGLLQLEFNDALLLTPGFHASHRRCATPRTLTPKQRGLSGFHLCRAVLALAPSSGGLPTKRLKTLVKCDWLWKPTSKATSTRDTFGVKRSPALAQSCGEVQTRADAGR